MTTNETQKWWRWPENHMTGRVAWFVILRRVLCLPLMTIGLMFYLVGVALAYGIADAKRALRELR